MKGKIIAVSVIVFALLVSGGVVYFLREPASSSYTYKVEDNFVYGVGYGKVSMQTGNTKAQRKVQAKRVAMDNARLSIIKAACNEDVRSSFIEVYSCSSQKISGSLKMPEIIEATMNDGRVKIKIRVPIVQIS